MELVAIASDDQREARVRAPGHGALLPDAAPARFDPAAQKLGTCMVKTHLSLSHNPDFKGRPRDWRLPIKDIMIYKGGGY